MDFCDIVDDPCIIAGVNICAAILALKVIQGVKHFDCLWYAQSSDTVAQGDMVP